MGGRDRVLKEPPSNARLLKMSSTVSKDPYSLIEQSSRLIESSPQCDYCSCDVKYHHHYKCITYNYLNSRGICRASKS